MEHCSKLWQKFTGVFSQTTDLDKDVDESERWSIRQSLSNGVSVMGLPICVHW